MKTASKLDEACIKRSADSPNSVLFIDASSGTALSRAQVEAAVTAVGTLLHEQCKIKQFIAVQLPKKNFVAVASLLAIHRCGAVPVPLELGAWRRAAAAALYLLRVVLLLQTRLPNLLKRSSQSVSRHCYSQIARRTQMPRLRLLLPATANAAT